MSEVTAEKLAQRIIDSGLLDARQLESVWSELGTRDVTRDQLASLLLRRELLTNFQIDRLIKGERHGYFYGHYKVMYLTGTGTFARVYRSVDQNTGRVVAVKVLRKRFRDDKVMTEQFLREGEIGSKLRHPNVVPILEVSKNLSAPYLVMDFVEGWNLREFIKVRKKLTIHESMRIVIDVLQGLAYAAEQGMSHRDLKLSNVLISSRGRARLVDFGLAAIKSSETIKDDDSPNARTIDYAGLERASGCRNNDPRSDLFFVGAMLYHMVTGVPALFETRDRIQRLSVGRYQNIKPIAQVDPNLPQPVILLATKALELNPEKRFQTPVEMLEEARKVMRRIEQGEAAAAAEALAAEANPASAAPAIVYEQEGTSRTIMVVESKKEMQDLLRDRLKRHGYRVLLFSDPQRAIQRFEEADHRPADCVLFSTVDLGRAALEAFNKFGAHPATKEVPAILFLDEKHGELARGAALAEHRVTLSMPLKVRELRTTLLKLLGQPQEA
jgi:serine/threonine-protein kinase